MITIDREFSNRLGNAALLKAPSVWNAHGHKATTTFAVENPATCEQIAHMPDFPGRPSSPP